MNKNLQKIDTIIKNGYIVTIDKQGTIIENGAIAIQKNKIIAINESDKILSHYTSDNIIDANKKIVMPGFVNTHTHSAMTVFRGMIDDVKLSEWLYDYIFPAENKCVNQQTVKIGAELAMIEMLHSGTTCFNDMYYFQDITGKIAKKIGLRGILAEGLIDFKVANCTSPKDGLKYTQQLIEKYKNDPLISIAVAAHSPYTCSKELIVDAKKMADKANTIFHIHVAETKGEFDTFMKKYTKTPVQYLDNLNVMSENTVIAHAVWLTNNDIEILEKRNVAVSHNPECNMKIASGAAKIPDMLKKNIRIGLGTDGVASNNNLNMIQELHTMTLLHKFNTMDPTVLPAEQAVRIATIEGAKVLRKDNEIGSLEIGKKADVILINNNLAHALPNYNVYSVIAYSLYGNEITDVIINGKQIMKNNKILTINENSVFENVREISKVITKKILTK